jgi:CRISPR/Cas system CMR-associated protein Cmr3 (group 5 of RAMP superfamily)
MAETSVRNFTNGFIKMDGIINLLQDYELAVFRMEEKSEALYRENERLADALQETEEKIKKLMAVTGPTA